MRAGGGAAQRVDHEQKLHQIVIGRCACALQDKNVLAAHVFIQLDSHFTVGELADIGVAQREIQPLGDLASKLGLAFPVKTIIFDDMMGPSP